MSVNFAVLWDLDGTLIDTTDLHVYAFIEALREMGYNANEEHAKAFRQRIGKRFVDIIKEIFPAMREVEIERLKNIRRRIVLSRVDLIKPLPPSRLLPIVSSVCPTALITSSNRQFTENILNHFKWRSYFDVVITGDDVKHGKPNPEPVLLTLKKLGVSRGVLIGDTEYDRLCAVNAGIMFLPADKADDVLKILSSLDLRSS
ncbi:HAD-superfamily hydrolase, subfamily IA, variant 1 [Archaeoglobus profundus DSM 5631]|uniref:HAD-superfamily hydrolase, subfamily IA, variant 1 n=2 Tax=Archaeoglobus profundus TaxID=84156 RepID=D2RDP1_ARCPA|nr:HAD-superfamily hydrolase, subfamily IA, variant 1 [Archaeoglobus profundus DSM 5631]